LIIYLEDKLKPAITKRELKKKCPGEKSGHIFNEIIQNNCPPPARCMTLIGLSTHPLKPLSALKKY